MAGPRLRDFATLLPLAEEISSRNLGLIILRDSVMQDDDHVALDVRSVYSIQLGIQSKFA